MGWSRHTTLKVICSAFPGLRALIAEHGEKRSLGDLLLEELYSFAGERWEQEDDITLLTLRRSAPPS